MSVIQSTVIDKYEDGSDITQNVDVLVWWRDVGQARFPRSAVMTLTNPRLVQQLNVNVCLVLLILSDLRKSLFEDTLEVIMWTKWGSPRIPFGRDDLHITHPELCD